MLYKRCQETTDNNTDKEYMVDIKAIIQTFHTTHKRL